ncbi:hypothetical protein VNO77_18870 [Canavalia gladiata]|uniref:Uncharacterized protein n=1 Tax=Canavalia gladiata TaxID=3824 RepID=A0AAN9LLQ3_CANGL
MFGDSKGGLSELESRRHVPSQESYNASTHSIQTQSIFLCFTSPPLFPFSNGVVSDISYGLYLEIGVSINYSVKFFSLCDTYAMTIIQDNMMMGANYYQSKPEIVSLLAEGKVPIYATNNINAQHKF